MPAQPVVLTNPAGSTQLGTAANPLHTTGGGGGGDATAANQVIGNASLSSIDGKTPALVTGRVPVDGSGVAQPVTLPAGTLRIGGTYPVGGQIIDEVPTVRTVNRTSVTASASGATVVVAAQGGGVRIRVLSVFVCTSTAVGVKFQSASTDISGLSALAANGGFVMPETQHGWFQTAANEALNVNLSGAATSVGVTVVWVQAT